MHPPPDAVDAIPLQRIRRDGDQRPQVRQTRPQPIERGDVRPVQLARARGPEALARVVQVPDVEVADLGALRGRDAADVAGGDRPGAAGADGEGKFEGEMPGGGVRGGGGDGVVEGGVRAEVGGVVGGGGGEGEGRR